MFSIQNKGRLVKKLENLNKYGPFFIIFPVTRNVEIHRPLHCGTFEYLCPVTSQRSRELVDLREIFFRFRGGGEIKKALKMTQLVIFRACFF